MLLRSKGIPFANKGGPFAMASRLSFQAGSCLETTVGRSEFEMSLLDNVEGFAANLVMLPALMSSRHTEIDQRPSSQAPRAVP